MMTLITVIAVVAVLIVLFPLDWVLDSWNKLKAAIDERHFRQGFHYAMEAHFLEGMSPREIETEARIASGYFTQWSWDVEPTEPFYKGVRKANEIILEKLANHIWSKFEFKWDGNCWPLGKEKDYYSLCLDGDVIFDGKRFTYSLFDGGWSEVKSTKDDEQ